MLSCGLSKINIDISQMFLYTVLFSGVLQSIQELLPHSPHSKVKNFQFHAPLATAHCAIATDEVEKKKKN